MSSPLYPPVEPFLQVRLFQVIWLAAVSLHGLPVPLPALSTVTLVRVPLSPVCTAKPKAVLLRLLIVAPFTLGFPCNCSVIPSELPFEANVTATLFQAWLKA